MAESHVISALVAKRAEISGQIEEYRKKLAELEETLGHLDASIKLFDPSYDLRSIKAKKTRKGNPYFQPRESMQAVLDVLREAEKPLSAEEISQRIAKGRKWPEAAAKAIYRSVVVALRTQKGNGIVQKAGHAADGSGYLWQIAP